MIVWISHCATQRPANSVPSTNRPIFCILPLLTFQSNRDHLANTAIVTSKCCQSGCHATWCYLPWQRPCSSCTALCQRSKQTHPNLRPLVLVSLVKSRIYNLLIAPLCSFIVLSIITNTPPPPHHSKHNSLTHSRS